MKNIIVDTSRVILALYFLVSGASKILTWEAHILIMETHNLPMADILLGIVMTAQIIGGFFLLLKKQIVLFALVFAIIVLLININIHDFWNIYEGVNQNQERQNFIKNIGLLIAFLLLAAMNIEETEGKTSE